MAINSHHVRIPLQPLPMNIWVNVSLDILSFISECFGNITFRSIEMISISSCCKVRRIFSMRSGLPEKSIPVSSFNYHDEKLDSNNYYSEELSKNLVLPTFIKYENININYDIVKYQIEENKAIKENSKIYNEENSMRGRSKIIGKPFENMYGTPEKELYSKQIFLHNGSSSPDESRQAAYYSNSANKNYGYGQGQGQVLMLSKSPKNRNDNTINNPINNQTYDSNNNTSIKNNIKFVNNKIAPTPKNNAPNATPSNINNTNKLKINNTNNPNIPNNQNGSSNKNNTTSNKKAQNFSKKNEDIRNALTNRVLNQWETNNELMNDNEIFEYINKTESKTKEEKENKNTSKNHVYR